MTTDSSIATIEPRRAAEIETAPDAIATSSRTDHAAVWDKCIGSLRSIWNGNGSIPEPTPTNDTIDLVIRILKNTRRSNPTNTPIGIFPDPDGGIIVEWRSDRNGIDSIVSVAIRNDRTIEITTFHDGVAVDVQTLGEGFPTCS